MERRSGRGVGTHGGTPGGAGEGAGGGKRPVVVVWWLL